MRSPLRVIDRLVYGMALFCGGLTVFGLLGLTVADVVFRYALNAPIFGGQDVSRLVLLLCVAFSIAYGGRTGAHVSVEVFTKLIGPWFERAAAIGVKLVGAVVLAVMARQLYLAGLLSRELEEGSQLLEIPFEPFYHALAVGMGLYALVLAVETMIVASRGSVDTLRDEGMTADRQGPDGDRP